MIPFTRPVHCPLRVLCRDVLAVLRCVQGSDLALTHLMLPYQYISANWPVMHVAVSRMGRFQVSGVFYQGMPVLALTL